MICRLAIALALLMPACPAAAQVPVIDLTDDMHEADPAPPDPVAVATQRQAGYVMDHWRDIAARNGFSGSLGMFIPYLSFHGDTERRPDFEPGLLWRWASVTKQVVAVLVMQEVVKGTIELDQPVAQYLPGFASPNADTITVRQLLRHQSGLPNPADVTDAAGKPGAFYSPDYRGNRDPLVGYCAGPPKAAPGGAWSYNNCDYMVAGALLEAVTGQRWTELVEERIARPAGLTTLRAFPTQQETRPGFVGGRPAGAIDLAAFGASGALYGSVYDLTRFGQALNNGAYLPPEAMAQLWDGRPELGYIALGQWVFEAQLRGCEQPVRIVERRGDIGGVQVRHFILPERRTSIAAFTDRGEFDFGEVWQARGFSYDLLSAAACPQEATP